MEWLSKLRLYGLTRRMRHLIRQEYGVDVKLFGRGALENLYLFGLSSANPELRHYALELLHRKPQLFDLIEGGEKPTEGDAALLP